MRTVLAYYTGGTAWCGEDAGAPCYDFGVRDLAPLEHVHAVRLHDGQRVAHKQIFDDTMAIRLPDAMAPPRSVMVDIIDREEWFARQRETA
jgi:hypothetical protein